MSCKCAVPAATAACVYLQRCSPGKSSGHSNLVAQQVQYCRGSPADPMNPGCQADQGGPGCQPDHPPADLEEGCVRHNISSCCAETLRAPDAMTAITAVTLSYTSTSTKYAFGTPQHLALHQNS